MNRYNYIKLIIKYLISNIEKQANKYFIISIILLFIAKICSIGSILIYKYIIDDLINLKNHQYIIYMSVLYGIIRILSSVTSEVRDLIFAKLSQNTILKVGMQVFNHVLAQSMEYHANKKTGALSRNIEKGLKGIEFLSRFLLFYILPCLLEVIFACFLLVIYCSFNFMIITVIVTISYIIYTVKLTNIRSDFRKKMNQQDGVTYSIIIESLQNYETVKYFNNEKFESNKLSSSLSAYKNTSIENSYYLAKLTIGQGVIISLGLTFTIILSVYKIYDGTLTVGDLIFVNMVILQIYTPLISFGFVYSQIKQALQDIEELFILINTEPLIKDKLGAAPIQVLKGEIIFKNVIFGYYKNREILKDLNIHILSNETVGIVGPSGSGKSTIVKLLFRLYEKNSGSIYIDNNEIQNITQESLHKVIGIVPQEVSIFNDSIYNNIIYGNINAHNDEVIEAVKQAQLYDFILKLPNGFETIVGEKGLKISGGEKQRIGIARLILKNSPIIIFDEATSALDYYTEKQIQKSIKNLAKSKTTIIIAHRLSTIVHANKIIYLEDGIIKEQGSHEELMNSKGLYYNLWIIQQSNIN